MRKISLLILLFAAVRSLLIAQNIVVTGIVRSAVESGAIIPGASVQVKGTSIGTTTDTNGKYILSVPQDTSTLIFAYVGMKKLEVEIAGRTEINIELENEIFALQEVLITSGYGIKQTSKSTSSLNQVISGDKLNPVRETNINNALAGKIAGIQIRGQSAVALERTGSVRLRGDGGFGTGNGAIYVVDGTILPSSSDLNLDEIENVSVLSGPSASAILGSQGANGAIIITTKRAKMRGDRTMDIEINSSVMTSSVFILPAYQNEYAGGMLSEMQKYTWKEGDPREWKSLDGKYYPDYEDDRNWGPRIEGQEYIPWYSWYPGTKYTGTTSRLVPQPDNVRDFYERGWTYNNNIVFSKAGDRFSIRTVIGNVAVKGNIPGSSQNKTNLSLKTSYDLTKKLTFGANINFFTTMTQGEFSDVWANQTTGSFNEWFHRDIDINIMRELRGLRTPDGIYASWNHKGPTAFNPENPKDFYAANYWYNPFTYFDLIDLPTRSDNLFGDLFLNYEIIQGLSVKVTYRRQQNNGWHEEKYSSYLNDSQNNTTYFSDKPKGYYYTGTNYSARENFESLITFTKKIGDFKVNANAGSDFFREISKANSANTVNGLNIKNLFTISNSVVQPDISNYRSEEKYRALFLRGDIGYRDFLFSEFTLRNDWYSTLPPSNNSVFSKSFGGAFVFNDFFNLSFLNYGKLRASWGEIPMTIDVYAYPDFQYSVGLYKRYGNVMMTTPDHLVASDIRGAVKTQKEIGLDLRFLKNKIGFSATYWDGTEKEIPLAMTIPGYSGFKTKLVNTGKIAKQGLDFSININPFSKSNLSYDLNATISYLIKNKVIEIAEGIDRFTVESLFGEGSPVMVHTVGRTWGELFGNGMTMSEGKPLLNSDGSYVIDPQKYFGSVLPKITGGVQNSFSFLKNFIVCANIDFQIGGKYFSVTDNQGSYSGLTAKTAGLNDKGNPVRDPVAEGGGVHVTGLDAITHEDVDYYIDAYDYYTSGSCGDANIRDLTFVKLREFSIGYNIPIDQKNGIRNWVKKINISFVCINSWMIYSASKDLDPSEISSTSGEVAQFPGTRSFGINVRINL